MQNESFNAPMALKSVMEGFAMSESDRGELLVLLLLTLARDATVGPTNYRGQPYKGTRHFNLTDFLYGQVFCKQPDPSDFVDENSIRALDKLPKDFPNSQYQYI
jgi:hypothetical protein